VLVTNGSAEANLVALMTLFDAGDEIVFFVPNFMQISGLSRALGIEVRQVPLAVEDGFQPDFDWLEAAIGPHTRAIAVTNPGNPTGTILSDSSWRRLVEMARGRNVWLLADEIYRGAEIDGPETNSLWGESSQVVVTGGLSKAFACPGLRLGWLIAPPEVIAGAARRQDYTSIGSGILSQALAEKIMQPARRERILARGRSLLATNVSCLAAWLGGRNGWSWVRPAAGGMAFVRYGYDIASKDFSRRLREEESVFVAAGSWFGLEGYIRIATGVETHLLAEGLARMTDFVRRTFGI
jgi:aspartate/methionine/tyrosine aminotransferase